MAKFNFKAAPKKKKVQRPIPKAGVTPARIVRIVEFGNQTQEWEGEVKNLDKVKIVFECVSQKGDFGNGPQPFWVDKEFTLSSHPKSRLAEFLSGIDADIETFDELLDTPLLMTVKHNKSGDITYANFGNATPPMEGFDVPELSNEPLYFSFDEPTSETASRLTEWEIKKIMSANNYEGSKAQQVIESVLDGSAGEEEEVDEEDAPWDK